MAIYRPVSETKTRVLIAKMILSTPKLIERLAPNGIENSPFSFMKPRTLEEEYREYRYQRAHKYKYNRMFVASDISEMLKPKYLKSFEEFKLTFTPVPKNMPVEMIYLLNRCMDHIFSSDCIVYDVNLRSYSFGFPDYYLFYDVLNDLNILQRDYMKKYRFFSLPNTDTIDLIPLYQFIFEMLKDEGLEWEYRNINVINLWKCELPDEDKRNNVNYEDLGDDDEEYSEQKHLEKEAMEYRLIKIRERMYLRYGYDENDFFYSDKPRKLGYDIRGNRIPVEFLEEIVLYQDRDSYAHLPNKPKIAESFEEEVKRINSLEVPESGKLIAYKTVYGKWPKGYPILKFDYL